MGYLEKDTYGMYKHYKDGPGPEVMGANTLIGEDVKNNQGDNLGDIKEIMLDTRSGRIAYAVLSYGGFLSMGEKLFAVPWNALKLDTKDKCFRLNVDKDRVKNAPGFDPGNWPSMADQTWGKGIHTYYGTRPYWE